MKVNWTLRFTALLMCLLSAGPSRADSAAEANAARIAKLEALVSSLEQRVSALEGPSIPNPAPAQDVKNQLACENKANWRSLRKGMTKAKVRGLLGEPYRIDASGVLENWSWGHPNCPPVTFYDERLYGWKEPN